MNDLQVFNNPEFGQVRTVTIDGEPWFVGRDVAVALGYENTKDALQKHVDGEDRQIIQRSQNTTFEIPNRGLTIINESGMYALIFGSKLESAKRFKHWVTSEVLPAIRKTGHYETQPVQTLKASSISEVVSMGKFIKSLLEDQGGTPYQVAQAVMEVSKQIGFSLSSSFLLPVKLDKVRDDELDMVEFAVQFPNSTYEDYKSYRVLLKMSRKAD